MIALPAYASQGGEILNQVRDWDGVNPTSGLQNPYAMAMDSQGNIILTGFTGASGVEDFYTVKFKADGSGILWRASYGGASGKKDKAIAVAVDSNDDVIVTGSKRNDSDTNVDIYTIKYSKNGVAGEGVALWSDTYSGTAGGDDYPVAIAVDKNSVPNKIYIGGYTAA